MTRELRMSEPYEGGGCSNCIFHEGLEPIRWSDGGGLMFSEGKCRRHPPALISGPDKSVFTRFPRVEVSDWCGEHRHWKTVRAVKGST